MRCVSLVKNTLILLLLVGCLSGCSKTIVGSGNIKSESHELGQFSGIEVRGPISAMVYQSTPPSIDLEADDNIISLITRKIDNGTLIIELKADRVDSKNKVKAEIHAPNLDHLSLGGSGSISVLDEITSPSMNLNSGGSGKLIVSGSFQKLDCKLGGSGEVELWGKTKSASFTFGGSGSINASNLQVSGPCKVLQGGSGSTSVWADGPLEVVMAGSGKVTYKGKTDNPSITSTGSGTVAKAR